MACENSWRVILLLPQVIFEEPFDRRHRIVDLFPHLIHFPTFLIFRGSNVLLWKYSLRFHLCSEDGFQFPNTEASAGIAEILASLDLSSDWLADLSFVLLEHKHSPPHA